MRRALPPTLVFLGTLLLTVGVLAVAWIGPQVRQAPIDLQSRTVVEGSGSYFDFDEGEEVSSDQLRSVTNTQSDQSVYEGEDPVSDDIAVYDQTSGLFDDATDHEINYSETRIAIDRVSAEPVDCCGAASEIEGLTIKWPFDTGPVDYPLWDGTLGDAVTATYAGEEDVDGLSVYRFEAEIPATNVGPATEDDEYPQVMYEASKTYLVEPETGRMVDVRQDVHQWLIDEDESTLFDAVDVSLAMSDEVIADNVAQAKNETGLLGILDLVVWIAPILGLVLLGAGIFLFRPRGGGGEHGVQTTERMGPLDAAPAR